MTLCRILLCCLSILTGYIPHRIVAYCEPEALHAFTQALTYSDLRVGLISVWDGSEEVAPIVDRAMKPVSYAATAVASGRRVQTIKASPHCL